MIRMNSNFLILFRLSKLDIQNLHKDRIAIDMDLQEFSTFCNEGWNKTDYSFIVIDFTQKPSSGKKYRHGFDVLYIPSLYKHAEKEKN